MPTPAIYCRYTELSPTDKLIENPKNPNTHPAEQLEKLARVIELNGWRAPIVVSKRSGFITKGHGRLQAAKLKGWTQVPVETQEYANEAEEYADMIADNKIAELAVGDDEKLKELVLGLNGKIDLGALGMAEGDLSAFLQPEIVDEKENPNGLVERSKALGEKWGVKRGDIYLIGGQHRLMCGDSTSQADVEALMAGQRAELLNTDPPYLVNYTGSRPDNNVNWEEGKDWDSSENVELYKTFLQVAYSHAIVESAPVYVWHAGKAGSQLLREAFGANGILEHLTIIWVKNKPVISYSWYAWQHEPCLMGWKKGNKPARKTKYSGPTVWKFLQDGGDLNQSVDYDALSTVWEVDSLDGKERPEHPTPKPPQLFMIPMRQHTELGAICYEPFAGSGSQIIAASIMQRKCYAMELSEKYCGVILERCVNYGLEVKKI